MRRHAILTILILTACGPELTQETSGAITAAPAPGWCQGDILGCDAKGALRVVSERLAPAGCRTCHDPQRRQDGGEHPGNPSSAPPPPMTAATSGTWAQASGTPQPWCRSGEPTVCTLPGARCEVPDACLQLVTADEVRDWWHEFMTWVGGRESQSGTAGGGGGGSGSAAGCPVGVEEGGGECLLEECARCHQGPAFALHHTWTPAGERSAWLLGRMGLGKQRRGTLWTGDRAVIVVAE